MLLRIIRKIALAAMTRRLGSRYDGKNDEAISQEKYNVIRYHPTENDDEVDSSFINEESGEKKWKIIMSTYAYNIKILQILLILLSSYIKCLAKMAFDRPIHGIKSY